VVRGGAVRLSSSPGLAWPIGLLIRGLASGGLPRRWGTGLPESLTGSLAACVAVCAAGHADPRGHGEEAPVHRVPRQRERTLEGRMLHVRRVQWL